MPTRVFCELTAVIGLLVMMTLLASAQSTCNINVDAGPDITICEGKSGQLQGVISGNYDDYEWTPATGLSSPFDLNPSVTIGTPMTYTLTARGTGSNVIVNGGFETGSIAPSTTGFSYVTLPNLPLSAGGSYTIGSSVAFGNIWGCATHSGTFAMGYHGTGTAGANIWCQTVPVLPNTDYKAEAWLMSIVIPLITTAPSITIEINGTAVASTTGSPTISCSWSNASGTWNSGGANMATVCIISNNGATNYGGIDDISLTECCVVEDEVMVDVEQLTATIQPAGPITCDNPILLLDATGSSSGPGFSYEWTTTDGIILSGGNTLMPTIGAPGTYRLLITSPSGCEKEAEIIIEGSVTPPDVRTFDVVLTCDDSPARVIATSSDPTVNFTWTGPNGFTSFDASFTTTVGGTYYVRAEDAYNCFSLDSVVVLDDRSFPDIEIIGDTISCGATHATLESKSTSWNLEYEWEGPNNFSSDSNAIVTADSGTYILTVIDSNGCMRADTFQLIETDLDFDAYAITDTITCDDPMATLQGYSDSSNVVFSWQGPNGFTGSGPSVTVTDSGIYILTVTYDSLCSKNDTIVVEKEDDVPDISIIGDTINCLSDSALLRGVSTTPNSTFNWAGPNGFSSANSEISVADSGTYTLTIIGPNGCEISEDFQVVIDQEPPVFSISGDTLTCDQDSIELSVMGLTNRDAITWTGPGGFTGNKENVTIDLPGIYVINVLRENGCTALDSIQVIANQQAPQVSLFPDTITCERNRIVLDASNQNVRSWSWQGPGGYVSDSFAIEVDQPGTYNVTITGQNGCDTTVSTEVFVDTIRPDFALASDTINCLNPEVILMVETTSLGTFDWKGPNGFTSSDPDPVVQDSGWYEVTMTGTNGCSTTDSIRVIQTDTLPDLTVMADTITCLQEYARLIGSTQSPNADFIWEDTTGDIISRHPEVMVMEGGTYIVKVIALDGCISTERVTVTVDTAKPQILDIKSEGLKCDSTYTYLWCELGPGVVSLEWTGPGTFYSTDQRPRVSDIGWYYLTVLGANGCMTTDSVYLVAQDTRPDVILSADTLSCLRDSAFLYGSSNSSNVTFSWTGPNGFMSNEQNPWAPTPGRYYLTVRDINDCSEIDSVDVTEDYRVTQSMWTSDSLRCAQDEAILTVETLPLDADVSWYNNGTLLSQEESLTVTQAGDYTLITIHPYSGCPDTIVVPVNQSSDTIREVFVFQQVNACTGEGLIRIEDIVGSTGPYQFSLDGGPFTTDPVFAGVSLEQHEIEVMDAHGCSFLKEVVLNGQNVFSLEVGPDFSIRAGEQRSITTTTNLPDSLIASIEWTPEIDLSCTDCLNPISSPDKTTTYRIVVTDIFGCVYEDEITITVETVSDIYVPNIFSPNGDNINDVLYIHTSGELPLLSLNIYDRWGELIFRVENGRTNDQAYGWNGTFGNEEAPSGVYILDAVVATPEKEIRISRGVTVIR